MAVKMAIQIQTRFAAFLTLLRFTLDGGIAEISPNAQVSDGSQPPLTFGFHPQRNGWLPFAAPAWLGNCSGPVVCNRSLKNWLEFTSGNTKPFVVSEFGTSSQAASGKLAVRCNVNPLAA